MMKKRIKPADLPVFDAASYLGSEAAIAAYMKDIRSARDAGLLAAARVDVARARARNAIAALASGGGKLR